MNNYHFSTSEYLIKSKLHLVTPKPEHKKIVMEFREEFLNTNERISGGVGLELADSYEDWLEHRYIPHYGMVEELIFLSLNQQNQLIGISDIRLQSNDFIQNFAGQIGYSVRPSQRNRGYASEILNLTLQQAELIGFKKILITCNEPNIASAKVIEKNGGILEKIIPHPNYPNVKRYYIDLLRFQKR